MGNCGGLCLDGCRSLQPFTCNCLRCFLSAWLLQKQFAKLLWELEAQEGDYVRLWPLQAGDRSRRVMIALERGGAHGLAAQVGVQRQGQACMGC